MSKKAIWEWYKKYLYLVIISGVWGFFDIIYLLFIGKNQPIAYIQLTKAFVAILFVASLLAYLKLKEYNLKSTKEKALLILPAFEVLSTAGFVIIGIAVGIRMAILGIDSFQPINPVIMSVVFVFSIFELILAGYLLKSNP